MSTKILSLRGFGFATAALLTTLASAAQTQLSDADWAGLNPGIPGSKGSGNAIAADGSGKVYAAGDYTFIGTAVIADMLTVLAPKRFYRAVTLE